jgi:hypothetical protein
MFTGSRLESEIGSNFSMLGLFGSGYAGLGFGERHCCRACDRAAYPRVPGHEVIGKIDAIGEGVPAGKLVSGLRSAI